MTRKEQVQLRAKLAIASADMKKEVERHIQRQIEAYNKNNNVDFKDVNECASYAGVSNYEHRVFCDKILNFSALAWNFFRSYLDSILAGDSEIPSMEDFRASLPVFDTTSEVPRKISMRRARLVLLDKGLLGSIQTAIDLLSEPDKSAAQIEWDYSTEVWRTKPFVLAIAQGLGWTEQDLDNLFREAMDKKYD